MRSAQISRVAFLSGGDRSEEELREVLRHAYSHGLELAITTIGMRGAIVYDGENFYTKKPFQINTKALDTMGRRGFFHDRVYHHLFQRQKEL